MYNLMMMKEMLRLEDIDINVEPKPRQRYEDFENDMYFIITTLFFTLLNYFLRINYLHVECEMNWTHKLYLCLWYYNSFHFNYFLF